MWDSSLLAMKTHRATISLVGKILQEDVEVRIEETKAPNEMVHWRGDAEVPVSSPFANRSNVTKTHHIALDDGREGDFLMELNLRVEGTKESAHIKFQGTGPLAAPAQNHRAS